MANTDNSDESPMGLGDWQHYISDQLTTIHNEELALRAGDERKMSRADTVDMCLIVATFALLGFLIWMRLTDWTSLSGPMPIAGVVIRRIFHV